MSEIKEGDVVNIHWEYVTSIFGAKVLYKPCATGDSWHLEKADGKLVYVQHFSVMEKQ